MYNMYNMQFVGNTLLCKKLYSKIRENDSAENRLKIKGMGKKRNIFCFQME